MEGDPLNSEHAIASQHRRKLADVVRIMQQRDSAAFQKPNFPASLRAKRIVPDLLPPGASFRKHTFACDAGERSYKLYKPSADDSKPRALIIMLHGCTQDSDDFAVGTRMNCLAHEYDVLIAYPEQASSANQLKCWNWFNSKDQRRDTGEPSIIAGLTRRIMVQDNIAHDRVYAAGLSAGGAMAAILGAAYPEIYSAVGVHSGLPQGSAFDVPSAFEVMRTGNGGHKSGRTGPVIPRSIIFHGDADSTVHPVNGWNLFQMACASANLIVEKRRGPDTSRSSCTIHTASTHDGKVASEFWELHGGGHAWSGGDARGSYVAPQGPCASSEMLKFFLRDAT